MKEEGAMTKTKPCLPECRIASGVNPDTALYHAPACPNAKAEAPPAPKLDAEALGRKIVTDAFAHARAEMRKRHAMNRSECYGELCICAQPAPPANVSEPQACAVCGLIPDNKRSCCPPLPEPSQPKGEPPIDWEAANRWANSYPVNNASRAYLALAAQLREREKEITRLTLGGPASAYVESTRNDALKAEVEAAHKQRAEEVMEYVRRNRTLKAEVAGQAFKAFVHRRLDTAGVPENPEPPKHALEGCRIGDRLDWIVAKVQRYEDLIVGKSDGDAVRDEDGCFRVGQRGSPKYEADHRAFENEADFIRAAREGKK